MPDPQTEAVFIWTLVSALLTLFVYGLVSYYLIFKSNLIINKLKLDKGFEQESISLTVHRSAILTISIIIIGGRMVASELPNFCRQLFLYFKGKRMSYGQTKASMSYSILSSTKILIGLFLLIQQRRIVNLIEWQDKN